MITLSRLRRDRPLPAEDRADPDPAAASPAAGRIPRPGMGELVLAHAPVGSRVVVTRVLGDERFRGRLFGLGILPGVAVSIAGGGPGRPRVLGLAGSRMAIDDRSSALVLVRHLPATHEGTDA